MPIIARLFFLLFLFGLSMFFAARYLIECFKGTAAVIDYCRETATDPEHF